MLYDVRKDAGLLACSELEKLGFQKTAQVARQLAGADLSQLADEHFCVLRDGERPLFPVFDVDTARVSAVYLQKHASLLTSDEAAAAEEKIRRYLPEFSLGQNKTAMLVPSEDDVVREFFGDPPEETAMERLESLRKEAALLTPKGKRDLAVSLEGGGRDLLKTASQAIPDIEDYTGHEVGTGFPTAVLMRKVAFPQDSREYEILSDFERDVLRGLVKAAEAVEILQVFDMKYPPDVGVPDPYQSVYRNKEASDPRESLRAQILSSRDKIASKWGDSVADQLAANPLEVYDSLPHPMQQEILAL